ncbi:MAG: hypothetical protein ACHQZR_09660 [Candidatus Limnocylindrales bacterium]
MRPRLRPIGRTTRLTCTLALVLIGAMSVGGCAAPVTAPVTSSASLATPTDTLPADLPADLCANTGVDCPLAAGQYLAQQFQPPIGFALDDGWTNAAYVERAIQMVRGSIDDPTESVSIVSGQLDGPGAASSSGASPSPVSAAAGTTAAQFLTYLGTLPGLTVDGRSALLLGGLPAAQVDVHVGKANVTLFDQPLAADAEDPFALRAGETARLVVVDVGTARVVFVIEVFGSAKLADFVQTEVQPLLTSVTFPSGP